MLRVIAPRCLHRKARGAILRGKACDVRPLVEEEGITVSDAVRNYASPSNSGRWIMASAGALCVVTYAIIGNWIYEGYVDLWLGVYGDDDDDDD